VAVAAGGLAAAALVLAALVMYRNERLTAR
jgi:hypothetical protein